MKKIIYLSFVAFCSILFACQSEEKELNKVGYLNLCVTQDVAVVTKTAPVEGYNPEKIGVTIWNSKGVEVELPNSVKEWVKGEKQVITLPVGTYTIQAASIGYDGSEELTDTPYYASERKSITIGNQETAVTLTCTLANVKFSVRYDDNLKDVFKDIVTTVNSITFHPNDTKSAYFPVGDLKLKTVVTNKAGITRPLKDTTFTEVKARNHYIINYKLGGIGSSNIKVTVDPTTKETVYNFLIGSEVSAEKTATLSANAWSNFAYFTAADISGTTADMALKFQYRKKGEEAWTDVTAKPDGKNYITDKITGLTPATTYEYQLIGTANETTSVIGRIASFTTDVQTVLINGNFDDWFKTGKTIYAASESYYNANGPFWDSSNPGTTTGKGAIVNKNPTQGVSSPVHTESGKAAKLESITALGKFAAASLYTGTFNGLVSTKGAKIDFGQPFKSRPTALHGFYQYAPKNIDNVGEKQPANTVKKGDMDICSIYIALSKKKYTVDNTNPSTFINFESDENIIAYGELPAADCVNTNGEWKEFTINLKYKNITDKPAYLIIVCSSSKYGDYFTGGKGSCLHLDDFELLYGDTPTMWE